MLSTNVAHIHCTLLIVVCHAYPDPTVVWCYYVILLLIKSRKLGGLGRAPFTEPRSYKHCSNVAQVNMCCYKHSRDASSLSCLIHWFIIHLLFASSIMWNVSLGNYDIFKNHSLSIYINCRTRPIVFNIRVVHNAWFTRSIHIIVGKITTCYFPHKEVCYWRRTINIVRKYTGCIFHCSYVLRCNDNLEQIYSCSFVFKNTLLIYLILVGFISLWSHSFIEIAIIY